MGLPACTRAVNEKLSALAIIDSIDNSSECISLVSVQRRNSGWQVRVVNGTPLSRLSCDQIIDRRQYRSIVLRQIEVRRRASMRMQQKFDFSIRPVHLLILSRADNAFTVQTMSAVVKQRLQMGCKQTLWVADFIEN